MHAATGHSDSSLVVPEDERLPQVVHDAAATLGHRSITHLRAGTLHEWANENLIVRSGCSNAPGAPGHLVRIDPLTFDMRVAAEDRAEAEASHFLWALSHGSEVPCSIAGPLLNDWADEGPMTWAIPETATGLATRTMVRAVQYIEAGVSPLRYPRWVAFGAFPSTVLELRRLARQSGRRLDSFEERLIRSARRMADPTVETGGRACRTASRVDSEMYVSLNNYLLDGKPRDVRVRKRQEMRASKKRGARSSAAVADLRASMTRQIT